MQNQRLGSMTSGERLYGIQEGGLPLPLKLQLQPGASLNSFRDAGKGNTGYCVPNKFVFSFLKRI